MLARRSRQRRRDRPTCCRWAQGRLALALLAAFVVGLVTAGCAGQPALRLVVPTIVDAPLEALRHELQLRVVPLDAGHVRLDVRDELHLTPIGAERDGQRRALVVWLHPDAVIDGVELDGVEIPFRAASETHARLTRARSWRVALPDAAMREPVLVVRAHLELGAPDTLPVMRSWFDGRVLYLAESEAWYPRLGTGTPAVSVEARLPEGYEACAEGKRIEVPTSANAVARRFESDTPSQGLSFVAGPWRLAEREVDGVTVRTLFDTDRPAGLDAVYLDALEQAIGRASSRLGDFPFPSFTVVEAPVRTMVAFPGFTVIDPAWLDHPRTPRAGIQHELLHSWFGHHVFLGPGGNWIEGLTTYLAEHEVLAGASPDHGRALRKRLLRDHGTSVRGLADLPVNAFRSGSDHASQSVGYSKVAMIFHMLRRQVGDEAFYDALSELVRRYPFATASWQDVVVVFEQVSGERLARFSIEWLERTGAPRVELVEARDEGLDADGRDHVLRLQLEQADPPYQLLLPVEVELDDGRRVRTDIELGARRESAVAMRLPGSPKRVTIDPDYEVFRELNDDEIEPTLRETLAATTPAIAVAQGTRDDRDIALGVELAMAAQLAERFELVEVDALSASERPALLVVPADALGGLRELVDLPDGMSWSDDGRPVLDGTHLAETASLAFAARTQAGTPRLVVFLSKSADAASVLTALEGFSSWSHVVFEGSAPSRRGMWQLEARSVSRGL